MLYDKSKNISADVGVIIGRFQVHKLHNAHRELIEHVTSNHKKTIIVLGVPRTLGSANNPLDFIARRQMIQESFPNVEVIAIKDRRCDTAWSKDLDARIREVSPTGKVILYGGRDSFIGHYKGTNQTIELESDTYINFSGTSVRKDVAQTVTASSDFRAGVIYGCTNRHPTGYPTVDIAIIDKQNSRLLLGQKADETKWRFIGGFFDPSKDKSYEQAARREVSEETGGMSVNIDTYLGSFVIDDWRYRNEKDKIITAFFQASKSYGPTHPSDDIAALKWFDMNKIKRDEIMEEHIPLMDHFMTVHNLKYFTVENNDISNVRMTEDGMNL